VTITTQIIQLIFGDATGHRKCSHNTSVKMGEIQIKSNVSKIHRCNLTKRYFSKGTSMSICWPTTM